VSRRPYLGRGLVLRTAVLIRMERSLCRDLLPLPLPFGDVGVRAERLCRHSLRRVHKRLRWQQWANDAVFSLNEMYGIDSPSSSLVFRPPLGSGRAWTTRSHRFFILATLLLKSLPRDPLMRSAARALVMVSTSSALESRLTHAFWHCRRLEAFLVLPRVF
jgi:hypothetical protein